MIRSTVVLCSTLLAFASLQGCASAPSTTSSAVYADTHPGHDECLVCKKNADLACVDIPVEKDTPHYLYNGREYHFCSDECRDKFAAQPAKYTKP